MAIAGDMAVTKERFFALVNYVFLLLVMFVIAAILTAAMSLQYLNGELPCPLCLLERVAMLGVCFGIMLNFRIKREVRARFGEEHVRGSGFYAFSRAAMPRFLRQPRPSVTFTGKAK